jgi:hypothetical protein
MVTFAQAGDFFVPRIKVRPFHMCAFTVSDAYAQEKFQHIGFICVGELQ